jgi:hypothetical protein
MLQKLLFVTQGLGSLHCLATFLLSDTYLCIYHPFA